MAIKMIKTANHEEWLALRKKYIGGSDAAAVIGLNNFSSPYSVWAEKTGRVEGFGGNLATEVGAYLEDFVAKKFEAVTGKKVRRVNRSFWNTNYPWALANIDREIIGENAGLEIKTTSTLNLKKFKNGEYPDNYYVQCVHYLAVTGKDRWYLAVLIGNSDFRWFVIERDEAEITALMQSEEAFWQHVTDDTPPPVDGLNATTQTIAQIYPDSVDKTVDLTPFADALERYQALTDSIKDLENRKVEVANEIKEYMADAATGECDGYRVSYKTSSRRTFDAKKFAEANKNIDLSSYYKHQSPEYSR